MQERCSCTFKSVVIEGVAELNQISDVSALSRLRSLVWLWLSDNRISDVSALSGLTRLWILDLRDNPLDCFAYCSVIPAIEKTVLANNGGRGKFYADPQLDECECKLFTRGDANGDGGVNITDTVAVLDHLFGDGAEPPCAKSADTNDSGTFDIADPIYLLNFLFYGGPPPPAPFSECGPDPTLDDLTCLSFEACQ